MGSVENRAKFFEHLNKHGYGQYVEMIKTALDDRVFEICYLLMTGCCTLAAAGFLVFDLVSIHGEKGLDTPRLNLMTFARGALGAADFGCWLLEDDMPLTQVQAVRILKLMFPEGVVPQFVGWSEMSTIEGPLLVVHFGWTEWLKEKLRHQRVVLLSDVARGAVDEGVGDHPAWT